MLSLKLKNLKSKIASQGIGTLIIFIALILVAAVAAGVLISTVGNLQGKSEVTGDEIKQKLGTGFVVVEVVANDTMDHYINASIDTIATLVELSPGGSYVKLDDITINMVDSKGAYTYQYNSTNPEGSTNSFGVEYIKIANKPGYVSQDDTIKIRFISSATIGEGDQFLIRYFPGT